MSYEKPTKVEAVVLDWAGTTVDFGSFAPTKIFVDAFKIVGLDVTLEEARGPMGIAKIDHIRRMLTEPSIAARWKKSLGREPTEEDVQEVYKRFLPMQIAKIGEYSDLIPGTLDTQSWLRKRNIKIGTCSGYPRAAMEKVAELCAKAGYKPDCWVASDDVPKGRPLPAQALENVVQLEIQDVSACVKIDDTVPGLLEGHRAGMWTVACIASSNNVGLSYEEWAVLSPAEQEKVTAPVKEAFKAYKPHYFINTIAELPSVIEEIIKRLQNGERP